MAFQLGAVKALIHHFFDVLIDSGFSRLDPTLAFFFRK
jgi:hypothetical protein